MVFFLFQLYLWEMMTCQLGGLNISVHTICLTISQILSIHQALSMFLDLCKVIVCFHFFSWGPIYHL